METAFGAIRVDERNKYYDVIIKEGFLTSRVLHKGEEMEQAYRLRHEVFAETLHWVPTAPNKMETDEYDRNAYHFGVLDKDNLLCYLRVITPEKSFMIEKDFISLIGNSHRIRKDIDTCEISRLCISSHARHNRTSIGFDIFGITMLLFKGIYHWCKINGIRYIYIVVAHTVLRMLNIKGVPCKLVGTPKVMPDGLIAVAAIIDWRDIAIRNATRKPMAFKWLSQVQSNPMRQQLPLHEACLSHRVSA